MNESPEHKPTIWVDADACPVPVREMLLRAVHRAEIQLHFVANHDLPIRTSEQVRLMRVQHGFDAADQFIVDRCNHNDLVISNDLALANDAIEKNATVISSRGERFSPANIRQKLQMRDFLESMRSSGESTGGPSAFGQSERKAFAAELDRWLASLNKG